MDQNDGYLIRQFLSDRGSGAFEELVHRHLAMVFAAAVRQVKNRVLAEDITQEVFIALVQKAGTLVGMHTLGGWLLKVTRYAAIDAMRKQARHRRHETAAAMERPEIAIEGKEIPKLSAILDEAMVKLRPADRDAIVLRYFEGREFIEIARHLGIEEEAARKRIGRSLEKLRGIIAGKGEAIPAASFSTAISSNSNANVSAALVRTIVSVASGAGQRAGLSISITKAMNAMKLWTKNLAALAKGAILIVGTGTIVVATVVQRPTATAPATTAAVPANQSSQSPSTQPQPLLTDASPLLPEDFLPVKPVKGVPEVFVAGNGFGEPGLYEIPGRGIGLFELLNMVQADATPAGLRVIRCGTSRLLDISRHDIASGNPRMNVMIHAGDRVFVLEPDDRLNKVRIVVTPKKLYMNGGNVDWDGVRAELKLIRPDLRKISFIEFSTSVKLSEERLSEANAQLRRIADQFGMVKALNIGAIPDITVFYLGRKGEGEGKYQVSFGDNMDSLSKISSAAIQGGRSGYGYIRVIRGIYEGLDSFVAVDSSDIKEVLAGKDDNIQLLSGDSILLSKIKGATTRP